MNSAPPTAVAAPSPPPVSVPEAPAPAVPEGVLPRAAAPTPGDRPPTITPPVNLFSPDALSKSVERGLAIAPLDPNSQQTLGKLPGEAAGERATTEAERVAARIAGGSVDANAKARVRMGLVDPTYARIGHALLDAWDPERALPESSVTLWTKQRAQNAAVSAQLMLETARRYAATGTPMVEGETLDEEVRSDRHDATTQATYTDQQRTRETFRQYLKGKFNEGRSAQMLVEEFPDGRIVVSLVKPSGDEDVDRGAQQDMRRAIARLHEDQGIPAKPRRTVWSLRLQIIINPPVPIGGFTFDEVLESPKLELPLGRKLLKRLQLEAVYDDDERLARAPASTEEAHASDAPGP